MLGTYDPSNKNVTKCFLKEVLIEKRRYNFQNPKQSFCQHYDIVFLKLIEYFTTVLLRFKKILNFNVHLVYRTLHNIKKKWLI